MFALLLLVAGAGLVNAAEWAVLVAGSRGYGNYRHQADVAHAFQIVKKHGIPESNIITMMYDDVASSPNNPFKGKLFNKPTKKGDHGIDVYDGINIDYKGTGVTPKVFMQVLTGDATGLENFGSGKVLKSTADDFVFINFVDHGAKGLVAFPSEELHVSQLMKTLNTMHSNKMYKKLVFYLEACESGSMFDGVLPDNIDVYATTASNPKESSWGTYCMGNSSMVNGKQIGSCLGDLYSVNWMENTDANPGMAETLLQQYRIVKKETTPLRKPTPGRPGGSHVMRYGDLSWDTERIGDFEGPEAAAEALGKPNWLLASSMVSAWDAELHSYRLRFEHAVSPLKKMKAAMLVRKELYHQKNAKKAFQSLVAFAYPGDIFQQERVMAGSEARPVQPECELAIHHAMAECSTFEARSGYALQFQRVAVNLCADAALGWQQDSATATKMAHLACSSTRDDSELVV